MNELENLRAGIGAFLAQHHVAANIKWAFETHPILCLAGILTFSACVASMPNAPRPEPKYEPLPTPQPVEPAAVVYGARRQLIQGQRAWMVEAARAQITAQLDGDTLKANGNAFADWFETRIIIPATATSDDVISFNDWAADYYAHCDDNSIVRLSDGDLYAHMDTYAKAYNCTLDQQGNYHGGHLKR
jgi:hypothetical protein